jgi:hypothetical protein
MLALTLMAGCGGSEAPSDRANILPRPGSDTPFIIPGVRQPEMRSAAEAELADDERIIGITGPGAPRAYMVRALSGVTGHVVNDMAGDVPVTVTYCDRSDCIRVLTADTAEPIDLWTGGVLSGKLAVRFKEQMYSQTSKDLPLQDYPFVLTTWKEWREAHPETVVYIGGGEPHFAELPGSLAIDGGEPGSASAADPVAAPKPDDSAQPGGL